MTPITMFMILLAVAAGLVALMGFQDGVGGGEGDGSGTGEGDGSAGGGEGAGGAVTREEFLALGQSMTDAVAGLGTKLEESLTMATGSQQTMAGLMDSVNKSLGGSAGGGGNGGNGGQGGQGGQGGDDLDALVEAGEVNPAVAQHIRGLQDQLKASDGLITQLKDRENHRTTSDGQVALQQQVKSAMDGLGEQDQLLLTKDELLVGIYMNPKTDLAKLATDLVADKKARWKAAGHELTQTNSPDLRGGAAPVKEMPPFKDVKEAVEAVFARSNGGS